jgi:hypothetical protein
MLLREITTLYYEFHTKPTNTLCGENVDIFYAKSDGKFCRQYNVARVWGGIFILVFTSLEYNKGQSGNSF